MAQDELSFFVFRLENMKLGVLRNAMKDVCMYVILVIKIVEFSTVIVNQMVAGHCLLPFVLVSLLNFHHKL